MVSKIAIAALLGLAHAEVKVKDYEWVNGLNMPWDQCGNDWGVAYNHDKFKNYLQKYKNSGANVQRQWVHFNGDKQLKLFDGSGKFQALDQKFYTDMKDNLQLMKDIGIKIHLTLFSFECADVTNCRNIIEDESSQSAYIENGLKPLIAAITDNGFADQIQAIEMFNEPEWMIKGTGGGVKHYVDLSKLQRFTKRCNDEIQTNGLDATVGSASLKWTCTGGHWCEGDWWGETNQSFRTVHYYSWMAQGGNQFDPFSTKPSDWGLTGPVLIGESPSAPDGTLRHGTISVAQQFYWGHQNGWMGVMPWADVTPGGTYNNIDKGLKCHTNFNSCRGNLEETEGTNQTAALEDTAEVDETQVTFLQQ